MARSKFMNRWITIHGYNIFWYEEVDFLRLLYIFSLWSVLSVSGILEKSMSILVIISGIWWSIFFVGTWISVSGVIRSSKVSYRLVLLLERRYSSWSQQPSWISLDKVFRALHTSISSILLEMFSYYQMISTWILRKYVFVPREVMGGKMDYEVSSSASDQMCFLGSKSESDEIRITVWVIGSSRNIQPKNSRSSKMRYIRKQKNTYTHGYETRHLPRNTSSLYAK